MGLPINDIYLYVYIFIQTYERMKVQTYVHMNVYTYIYS